jgi:predicted secreted protein
LYVLASFAFALALLTAPLKGLVVKAQPTNTLHLKLGQRLVFSVFGNETTGANWSVKAGGTPGLKSLGVSVIQQKQTNPPRAGQGATYLISFRAVKKGTYNVKLIYGRSWELAKGAKPWGTRTAKVVIQ